MLKTAISLVILFFSASILAGPLDGIYYTQGNFTTIVDALKRVALFYGENQGTLIAGMFALGLLVNASTGATNGLAQIMGSSSAPDSVSSSFFLSIVIILSAFF